MILIILTINSRKTDETEDAVKLPGLSSSDMDYLTTNAQKDSILAETSNPEVALNPIVTSTCDYKGNDLQGEVIGEISDQFVQLQIEGVPLQFLPHAENKDKVQEVSMPATLNSVTAITNTVTNTSTIRDQVAQMSLVDVQNCNQASTSVKNNFTVQTLNLPGAADGDGNKLLQLYPVHVLTGTGTTTTPEMYVLLMEIDDGTDSSSLLAQEEVHEQVAKTITLLEKNDNIENLDISKLQEPQRSSTSKFDPESKDVLNDTILDGNIQRKEEHAVTEHDKLEPTEVKRNVSVNKEIIHPEKEDVNEPYVEKEILSTNNTTEKEKENTLDRRLDVHHKRNLNTKGIKKQLCIADMIGKIPFNDDSRKTHNETYCQNWVSTNCNSIQKLAQNDSIQEQDSCDSSLLQNVTSVSKHKWVKPNSKKLQVDNQVKKPDNDNM